ncbi:hypothetical protein QN277_015206 [Acacia crassicarpa]|uniref:Gag1-like clamp domain-containing protein n=1 Tax=Acacia crassicarpa TaxID=499986 RepID=A0AAE1JTR5_9FABA|nr:hypothetical protein QN277_015206 [Acacia crassicarpa]
MQFYRSAPPWVRRILACIGGCIGYTTIPQENTSIGGKSNGQTVREDRLEDLSSSCIFEMDPSASQSQENSLSIGTSNQPSDPQTSTYPQIDHPVFINHGLLLWNQTREQWLQRRNSERRPRVREPIISEDETYESLLGSNEPFPQPIPLGEMVDFLDDIWEMEDDL